MPIIVSKPPANIHERAQRELASMQIDLDNPLAFIALEVPLMDIGVNYLRSLGKNINGRCQITGITPLIAAISQCSLPRVQILLSFGALPEVTCRSGIGPLEYCHRFNTHCPNNEYLLIIEELKQSLNFWAQVETDN